MGETKSCGCLRYKYKGYSRIAPRLFSIWKELQKRCYNQNNLAYKYYKARGITVCDDWKNNFENFYNWSMNNGYNNNLSIDRIDVNGNYEPNNCRWITVKEQANNKRNNHYITINKETKTLIEWCEQYNIKYRAVRIRINQLKWDPLKALTTPIKPIKLNKN